MKSMKEYMTQRVTEIIALLSILAMFTGCGPDFPKEYESYEKTQQKSATENK